MALRASLPRPIARHARHAWLAALICALAAMTLAAACAATGKSHDVAPGVAGPGDSGDMFANPSDQGDAGAFTLPAFGDGGGNAQCNPAHKCGDFPASPVLDPLGSPSGDPAKLFGAPGAGSTAGGPCLIEPADKALYPKNWLRPRAYWSRGSSAQTVFEVRVHSDAETDDLVVYTTNDYYALDESLWEAIAKGQLDDAGGLSLGHLVGASLTFTVRASDSAGGSPSISNSATLVIAPAIADGALVYWTTADFDNDATNTTLQGFHVGDEGTTAALTSSQVAQTVRAEPVDGGNLTPQFQQVFCIGCHSATPDGQYVSFTAQWPWPIAMASIQSGSAGAKPPWLSNGAVQNLSPDMKDQYSTYYAPPAVNQVMLGMSTFSPAHYRTGDRVLVSSMGASWNSTSLADPGAATGVVSQIAWFDLEWNDDVTSAGGVVDSGLPAATPCSMVAGAQQACIPAATSNGGWGIVQRTGDSNSAGSPSWSHDVDGQTDFIAYSSTNAGTKDGRMDCTTAKSCTSDVYVVPYGAASGGVGGAGGTAKPLGGAADPRYNEYYPSWSPDDRFIAYNRVPSGTGMYDEPKAEVYVVPFAGGQGGTPVSVTEPFPPPSCTNPFAGGVENTLPKWAPNPLTPSADGGGVPLPQVDVDGNTFYWLTFSSIRSPLAQINASTGKPKQQLYVAGIVVDKQGGVHPYAPIYLWNQSYQVNNLIPAWGEFSFPAGQEPPPPPPPPK
jgi:hypothetical protein